MDVSKIRIPNTSSIGIKPVSSEGTKRIVRAAIRYSISNSKNSVTLVHKVNIMKFNFHHNVNILCSEVDLQQKGKKLFFFPWVVKKLERKKLEHKKNEKMGGGGSVSVFFPLTVCSGLVCFLTESKLAAESVNFVQPRPPRCKPLSQKNVF